MEEISVSNNVDRLIPVRLEDEKSNLRLRNSKPTTKAKSMDCEETMEKKKKITTSSSPAFANLTVNKVLEIMVEHPVPFVFLLGLLIFMGVEYTIPMIPTNAPPLDLGFWLTESMNQVLAARPNLNSFLAFLNTVFVLMQSTYILWCLLVEGRPRATIAAVFMFTCRGILGSSTQLPLPEGFLGSGVDFPVGNVSFFLFFSGHVAGSVIASLDMRRVKRRKLALTFDVLNLLQMIRLLASRGHYTIDLATGLGAGFIFDIFAGYYLERSNYSNGQKRREFVEETCVVCKCNCERMEHAVAGA
ncbi:hypothetical protein LUZ60_012553 [Juncus effusus]|nr:hypothetical protein LUZ60_012553 [Juncus effusus]